MGPGQVKAELRKKLLQQRDAIDPADRLEWGLRAADIGSAQLAIKPGQIVSGFFPIRSEIDARPLMDKVRQKGARLCLPVVINKTTIVFRELVRGAELISTGFGTMGPGPECDELDPQLLIMPLSIFDRRGGRVGYGAGHYDRAIARLRKKGASPVLAGLAFSCQELDTVPVEAHDQPLDCVITEREFIVTRSE